MSRRNYLLILLILTINLIIKAEVKPAEWLIVGFGPAGLIAAAVLRDIGVPSDTIMVLDPLFECGRMGQFYEHVESNNKAKEFVAFINASPTFQQCSCPAIDTLKNLNPEQPCLLECIVEPLRCITAYLRTQLLSVQDTMQGLSFYDDVWHVTTKQNGVLTARHVILATGSRPRTLNVGTVHNVIPLDHALDPDSLKTLVTHNDIIGVIGGAHSAILLLKYLSTMDVKHIYNFYRHPISYAIGEGCWALDQFGVKGTTGEWAKNVLEKNPPANITRIRFNNLIQLRHFLRRNRCNKLIYAIGFEQNPLPAINGTQPITTYNGQTGVIAPRLFGIGIAFPEHKIDDGHPRYIVGLNCFMDYAQRMIPQWSSNRSRLRAMEQKNIFAKMEDLLTISVL